MFVGVNWESYSSSVAALTNTVALGKTTEPIAAHETPIDDLDKALAYQHAQAEQGIFVSTAEAVSHVCSAAGLGEYLARKITNTG